MLQDYNALVLRLLTLPNIVLAWCKSSLTRYSSLRVLIFVFTLDMSSASASFRTSNQPFDTDPDVEEEPLPPVDPTQTGTLPLSPELVAAFLASLKERRITIRLFSGSWEGFNATCAGGPFDVVLTSETIYRPESLRALVKVMRDACTVPGSLEEKAAQIKIGDANREQAGGDGPYLCLVAAKRVYFGVGGGVAEFIKAVEEGEGTSVTGSAGSKVEMIWERTEGVKRIVMRVTW